VGAKEKQIDEKEEGHREGVSRAMEVKSRTSIEELDDNGVIV